MSIEENDTKLEKWYEMVIEKYTTKIRKHIWYVTYDKQLIDDLYQDVFEKIIKYTSKLMELSDGELDGYIRTITRTVIIDYYRKQQRMISCISGDWESICENNKMSMDPGNYIINQECMNILNVLPQQTKDIMQFRIIYSMPFETIGKRMNITAASARKKYERGRKKLLKIYRKEELCRQWNIPIGLLEA